MKYAERLACESKWSQATYRYLKAAFLIQFMDDEDRVADDSPVRMVSSIDAKTDRKASLEENIPLASKGYHVRSGKPKPTPIYPNRDCSGDADGGAMSEHVEKLLE